MLAWWSATLLVACAPQIGETKAMSSQQLQSQLESDLPLGQTAAQVEVYLKDKGYENSGLIDNAELAHMGADPDSFAIKSIVRSKGGAALVSTDVSMTFSFDRDKKLTAIEVKDVHTGP